uniref:TLC domain-containing protein n=1 Tax=Buteo japonicus TaxID=224669 RepID=A0A8C0B346_9AVES
FACYGGASRSPSLHLASVGSERREPDRLPRRAREELEAGPSSPARGGVTGPGGTGSPDWFSLGSGAWGGCWDLWMVGEQHCVCPNLGGEGLASPRARKADPAVSHPPPHSQAISAFVSLIITGRFLVAAMLLLLVEVSNIFLTVRMLLKMSNVPSPALYEANKYINLVMYFAFRLAPQAYLTWYFLRYVEVQGQGAFLTANLLLLDAMILMYFSRLLRSDFFPSLHKGSARRDVDGEKFLID